MPASQLVFGLIAALIVKFYAPFAAGSGIPEVKVIIGGFVYHRFLSLRILFFKALALVHPSRSRGLALRRGGPGGLDPSSRLALRGAADVHAAQAAAVSTSLNLGKEGPMIHVAASAAQFWTGMFASIRNNEGACLKNGLSSLTGRVVCNADASLWALGCG